MRGTLVFSTILATAVLALLGMPWMIAGVAALLLVGLSAVGGGGVMANDGRNFRPVLVASEVAHAAIATGAAYGLGALIRLVALG
jgi:hypothetical protein